MTLTGLLSVPSYAAADQSVTNSTNVLKISPVRSDIQIAAGSNKSVPVTISNLTGSAIKVSAIENDFVAGDEKGTPSLILDADQYASTHSLKRFMTPLNDVTVPANNAVTVNVVITVPSNAQAGGYFGAIRFAPSDPNNGGQVNLSASVASIILLTVPGPTVEKLSLTNFEIQQNGKNSAYFSTPTNLQVYARFENNGNLQEGPFGQVTVQQGTKVLSSYDFNTKNPRDEILPDSARYWNIPLKNVGTIGHFTVSATFTYGQNNQTIDVTRSFWVIPLWAIIAAGVAVLVLVGVVILVIFLIRRNKRRRRMYGRRGHMRY
jgi:hypothetical protein